MEGIIYSGFNFLENSKKSASDMYNQQVTVKTFLSSVYQLYRDMLV